MSLVATKIVNRETLYFGLANLYLGDSATNEAANTAVLTSANYFACLAEISFSVSKNFKEVFGSKSGIKILSEVLLVSSELEIEVEFVELTQKNFSYALGGSGSGSGNILDTLLAQPANLRVELVFTYPNKTNKMTVILPKCKVITKKVTFEFQAEDPMVVPMTIVPLFSTHASWSANIIGKVIFV